MSSQKQKLQAQKTIWGPELMLVFVLPIILITAIVITVCIALEQRFTPSQDVQTDRFARPIEPRS